MSVVTEDAYAAKTAAPAESIKLTADKITVSYANTGQWRIQPLYMVNGVQVDFETIQQLDPNTIQSIEVLKDSQNTLTYGPDGKNGVIKFQLKPGVTYKAPLLKLDKPAQLQLRPVEDDTYKTEQETYKTDAETYEAEVMFIQTQRATRLR